MGSRQSSITQSRKALEARFELVGKTVLANVKAALESEKAALLKDFDERLLLQAQLPGMDLSAYDVVQKFDFPWIYAEARAVGVKVGDQIVTNVTVEPRTTYEGFFLFRKRPEAKKP